MERYNADLANDLGNLLSRARALLVRHLDGALPTPEQIDRDREVIAEGEGLLNRVRPLVDQLRFFEAAQSWLCALFVISIDTLTMKSRGSWLKIQTNASG